MTKFTKEERKQAICTDVYIKIKELLTSKGATLYKQPLKGNLALYVGDIDPNKQSISFVERGKKLFIYKENGKLKFTNTLQLPREAPIENSEVFELLDVEVKNSALSGKVFGKAEIKEQLVNKIFKGGTYSIKYGNSKKLESETYYIELPIVEEIMGEKVSKFIKFVLSDVEFLIPNLKGYCFPKDRTIRIGNKVILNYDKFSGPWEVLEVIKDNTSKKLHRNSENRKNDVVLITKNGRKKKVFVKYLKKYEEI